MEGCVAYLVTLSRVRLPRERPGFRGDHSKSPPRARRWVRSSNLCRLHGTCHKCRLLNGHGCNAGLLCK